MKLNKIQRAIYDEYIAKGRVWADCPRQSGKTEILLHIAEMEIRLKNTVFIKSLNRMSTDRILAQLRQKMGKDFIKFKWYVVFDEALAKVVLYDEIYYDLYDYKKGNPKKIVCLRTRLHPTFQFTYLDLPKQSQKLVLGMKKIMSKEQWDVKFNNKPKGAKHK